MKILKRRVKLGRWLAHQKREAFAHWWSLVTRKERMEKELGRPIAVEEMFKVTHVKKITNPTEEERWIEPRAQQTYSAGEPIRGSIYGYLEKTYHKKKAWYCGSSSSSFDVGDTETIFAMEGKIDFFNAELTTVANREKKREERERKRDEEIAAAKKTENKRYAALQAQLIFLFESGKIIPPCSESEGEENDKSDKESEGDEK
ncbi:hypothetical protein H5410_046855 [Solanum commersonii]|uniref:Uncharacterized protein n=1 Tax=Solanum commersonii TaxID=4109 RepID=A0A9J5XFG0_SOLCO|nr:hypothetical protein H5410_046855 [Solanum commersonii]